MSDAQTHDEFEPDAIKKLLGVLGGTVVGEVIRSKVIVSENAMLEDVDVLEDYLRAQIEII